MAVDNHASYCNKSLPKDSYSKKTPIGWATPIGWDLIFYGIHNSN